MKNKRFNRFVKRRVKSLRYASLRKKTGWVFVAAVFLLVSVILPTMQQTQNIDADRLLDTIAAAESKSNYNAYFGNPQNTSVQFTSMTVGEVLLWQEKFVQQGSPSSAVGRYQFIDTTLKGLVEQTDVKDTDVFDKDLQDKLAFELLERRGIREYVDEKIDRETFAHNLSKEWAGLPKVLGDNPQQSYYANDGLNKAQVEIDEVLEAIDTVREIDKTAE